MTAPVDMFEPAPAPRPRAEGGAATPLYTGRDGHHGPLPRRRRAAAVARHADADEGSGRVTHTMEGRPHRVLPRWPGVAHLPAPLPLDGGRPEDGREASEREPVVRQARVALTAVLARRERRRAAS